MRWAGTFHLFEFEFVGPEDDRTPDQLIQQNDKSDHSRDTPQNAARIAVACGGLQERAKPRQAEIPFAQYKHFASHQKKPPAGNGDHGVPDQANGGERKIQFSEALPAAEPVNDGRLAKIAGNSLQRRVKTKSDVPGLPGENQQNRAELDAQLAMREKREHR